MKMHKKNKLKNGKQHVNLQSLTLNWIGYYVLFRYNEETVFDKHADADAGVT